MYLILVIGNGNGDDEDEKKNKVGKELRVRATKKM